MSRRIIIRSSPTTEPNRFVEVEVYYDAGGRSFLSGEFNKRGYYLAVQPVKREGNCRSMLAFSGTKTLLLIQAVPSGTAWFLDLAIGGRHEKIFANGCGQETDWRRNRAAPQPFTNLELAKSAAEEELGRRLNRPVRISPQVELCCPSDAPVYDYLKSDVEFARARYDAPTDSICSVPEGCRLVSWRKGNLQRPRFHIPKEGAHIPADCRWQTICPKAHQEFLKAHNQRPGPGNAKRWLAWLISEYRKYGLNS